MNTSLGFLNLNKPLGMTSHDAVARARRGLEERHIGHAGTLDPLANGVLILCVGAAARLSDFVMHQTKRYTARVRLGVQTTTDDAEGEIVHEHDPAFITRTQVETALTGFIGEIEQVPPAYSAIKQGGRKAYDRARAGEVVNLPPRQVSLYQITLIHFELPIVTLDIQCSAGTYIRSIARDLGERLGVGGSLAGLTRTASGAFTLATAAMLDQLHTREDWQARLIPPHSALPDWPQVLLDDSTLRDVRHGRAIVQTTMQVDGTYGLAYDEGGTLIALLVAHLGKWKPDKVFV